MKPGFGRIMPPFSTARNAGCHHTRSLHCGLQIYRRLRRLNLIRDLGLVRRDVSRSEREQQIDAVRRNADGLVRPGDSDAFVRSRSYSA